MPFPSSSRQDKLEAGQWIARLDRGLTSAEHEELQQWMSNSRRREVLMRLAEDWDDMSVVAELADLFPLRKNEDTTWTPVTRVAAVIGAAVALGAIALTLLPDLARRHAPGTTVAAVQSVAPEAPVFRATYSTPIGKHLTVELPDHSHLRLNTNTELQVEYSQDARLLTMTRGEALFEVAKDPDRVFRVRVAGYDFKAVGTAFDIRADAPGSLRLTVTEGRVRVHPVPSAEQPADRAHNTAPRFNDATDVVVGANQAVSIEARSQRIDVLTASQVAAATAWQRGVVVFDATPLSQVVAELSRYSTERWIIAEPALAHMSVSGYFQVGDTQSLIAALQQNIGIRVTRHNGDLLLSGAQQER
jgi:transmembrane sensor